MTSLKSPQKDSWLIVQNLHCSLNSSLPVAKRFAVLNHSIQLPYHLTTLMIELTFFTGFQIEITGPAAAVGFPITTTISHEIAGKILGTFVPEFFRQGNMHPSTWRYLANFNPPNSPNVNPHIRVVMNAERRFVACRAGRRKGGKPIKRKGASQGQNALGE